jgi:UDP-N-acetylglucosamine 1-carboxyvinyltransferase
MKKYIIKGGNQLSGEVSIAGAKNVALKAIVAACLTSEKVILENVPKISDVHYMLEMVRDFGGEVEENESTVSIEVKDIKNIRLPLETAIKMRTSSLFFAPFIVRKGEAEIPNPGGDKIGARRIDMHIEGLKKIGVNIYAKDDGYFYAEAKNLKSANYRFKKNTHTGTEQMILASVMINGKTILENCAQEPEVDELIELLNKMGAKIKRTSPRTIRIDGVKKLRGTKFRIKSDRNEAATFAIASALTGGNIWLKNADKDFLENFIYEFRKAGGEIEENKSGLLRFYIIDRINASNIKTEIYPGFMTDWQGPWCVLMTQAEGESIIHETIYEDRFQYVHELKKMGAQIELFNPKVEDPDKFYNFNFEDCTSETRHAIRIKGKTKLNNAVLTMMDLRAGATLVLASLIAKGESVIYGVEQIERGYEKFDERLKKLGADIKYIEE